MVNDGNKGRVSLQTSPVPSSPGGLEVELWTDNSLPSLVMDEKCETLSIYVTVETQAKVVVIAMSPKVLSWIRLRVTLSFCWQNVATLIMQQNSSSFLTRSKKCVAKICGVKFISRGKLLRKFPCKNLLSKNLYWWEGEGVNSHCKSDASKQALARKTIYYFLQLVLKEEKSFFVKKKL